MVFVNYAHPEVRHVSSMRLFFFAKAMAARGHQVVLLTGKPPAGKTVTPSATDVAGALSRHDWAVPLVLSVAGFREGSPKSIPGLPLHALLRKARTAWALVVGDGVYAQWVENAGPVIGALAESFRPDLVWATFGNTSNLVLGQSVARRAHCPWMADVKDNWNEFVPRGLRKAVASRFRDVTALTTNSRLHSDTARVCFGPKPLQVLYSGVADEFYQTRLQPRIPQENCTFALVGSTYSDAKLAAFLDSFREWRGTSSKSGVRLAYAGSDAAKVSAAADAAGLDQATDIHGQLSLGDLATMVRQATAVCYLWEPTGFHHKLLELLVVGTPVVCYPHEHAESMVLAAQSSTPFFVCADRQELMRVFDVVLTHRNDAATEAAPPAWTWADMCLGLETFFNETLKSGVKPCAA